MDDLKSISSQLPAPVLLIASTGSVTNPFLYTAREFDLETGVYFYRARYYDPSVGRFNSEDPIGFAGGANFYRYGGNDPATKIDPAGLDPYDLFKDGRRWVSRSNCLVNFYYCLSKLYVNRLSQDGMSADAVVNTASAEGVSSKSNMRLRCTLRQDENCDKTLQECTKFALTNPFPPPWWLKDLINWAGHGPAPNPPKPEAKKKCCGG